VAEAAPGKLLVHRRPGVGGRALGIATQMAQEQRAVAALEADLVIVHDQRRPQPHHQPISAASARAFASSSGVLTFMNAISGARWRATASLAISRTRTAGKTRT